MPTYKATITATGDATEMQVRLIEAKTEAAALKHVVGKHIVIAKPTSADLVALGREGIAIEEAGAA